MIKKVGEVADNDFIFLTLEKVDKNKKTNFKVKMNFKVIVEVQKIRDFDKKNVLVLRIVNILDNGVVNHDIFYLRVDAIRVNFKDI